MRMKTYFTLLILLLGYPLISLCQTGPGGVGSKNGASNLILWMDANTVAGTNGSTITSWDDASGYNHNFTVGNGAVLTKPAQNGNAAFTFDGGSHYFERAYTAALSPTDFTVFTTANVTDNGGYKALLSNRDDNASTAGYILYAQPTDNFWTFWTGSVGNSWDQLSSGISTQGTWASQMLTYETASGTKEISILQGAVLSNSGTTVTPNAAQPIRIGAGNNEGAPDFYFEGSIGEVIIYNTVLNNAQRIIVQNYLSAKYDYALTSDDLYIQDNPANGDYDHDVAGIGRVDAANQHTDAQGNGIVRILNATDLGDNEFLLWGHDNGQQEARDNSDVPLGVESRFIRVWRVNEVNAGGSAVDVGSIDMRWDLNNLGNVTASDLRLLIDTDNDGSFADETPISGATALGGGIYAFAGVSTLGNNMRFTLATTNLLQTPLPINLSSFSATPVNKKQVLVSWKTSTETNNAYFTVLRSKDNISWEEVKVIPGAGNSSVPISYSIVDDFPYSGISFYRLKQTDINSNFTYSAIKSVNLKKSANFNVSIYPNPAVEELIIKADEDELERISVYSMVGQDITNSVKITKVSSTQLSVNVAALKPGMYILKTKTTTQKITKQ